MRSIHALAFLWFLAGAPSGAGPASLLVVTSSAAEPYVQALDGVRQGMAGQAIAWNEVDLSQRRETVPQAVARVRPSVVIAIGTEAAAAVAAQPPAAPVVSSMILRADAAPGRALSTVSLDVPPGQLVGAMQRAFPGASRLGIIRGPSSAHVKSESGRLQLADCPRAEDLLKTFLGFKGKVEFVACMPDGALYNSSTVKPLVLASLQNRLPLIGYSEGFARAGAVLAVYPDYRDVGALAAETARKLLAGQDVPSLIAPRRFRSAVNQRVVRLLGLSYQADREEAEVVIH